MCRSEARFAGGMSHEGAGKRMIWSIRNRIMVPYTVLIVALVGGTGLATAHWAAAWARSFSIERGRGIAETLQRSRFPLTDGVLGQLKGLGGAEFVLIGANGRVQASTLPDRSDIGLLNSAMGHEDQASGTDLSFDQSLERSGVEYRVAVVDRGPTGGAFDSGRVLILLPETTLRAVEWEARRTVLAFTLVGASLAVILASGISRTLSRPLSSILAATRAIARGNLDPEGLPTERRDEIGELALGVGQMAGWLRRLQDERVQTERLLLIRQLSAGLAHELRNPLTAARMTLQIFVERNRDRDTEPLRIALDELARVERHVCRFLQLARPEPPQFESTAILPVIERCSRGLVAVAGHRGIALEVRSGGVSPLPLVRVDPEQMGQVVTNLIGNALDAAGPGGRVVVDARPGLTDGVEITIADNGPGVPDEARTRLFEPFFTTRPEGVGLGLSLCAALVREHGGTIDYARQDGWTQFRVTLPGANEADGVPHAETESRAGAVVPESLLVGGG